MALTKEGRIKSVVVPRDYKAKVRDLTKEERIKSVVVLRDFKAKVMALTKEGRIKSVVAPKDFKAKVMALAKEERPKWAMTPKDSMILACEAFKDPLALSKLRHNRLLHLVTLVAWVVVVVSRIVDKAIHLQHFNNTAACPAVGLPFFYRSGLRQLSVGPRLAP
jgi:hypothetical protein